MCSNLIVKKPEQRQSILADIFIINPSCPGPGQREKINLNFYFTLLCGASQGFMKAFKAFIKPFEAPQRSVKIKV